MTSRRDVCGAGGIAFLGKPRPKGAPSRSGPSSVETTPRHRTAVRAAREERVFLRDVKPYEIIDSLDQPHGPVGGVVELSHAVRGHPVARPWISTSPAAAAWPSLPSWPKEPPTTSSRS